MAHNWSSAHLHQAYSDYKMFKRIVKRKDVEDCQKIYFLLKIGEKAAQSYLTDGRKPPRKDHDALLLFIQAVKSDPLLRSRISIRFNYKEFVKKVKRIEQFAQDLHYLVARNQKTANCEYPWEDENGVVQVPSEKKFSVMGAGTGPMLDKYVALFEMWFERSGLPVAQSEIA